jgi:hypothetical protein
MDPYTFCLLLGGLGLVGMSLTGVGRHGGHGHARSGHAAHGATHSHGGAQGRGATHSQGATRTGHAGAGSLASRVFWSLMSPRVLFTVLLGTGATGLLLRHTLGSGLLAGVAVAGGLIFEAVLVRPVWNATMRFASRPALTLESCVTDPATAVTAFDAHGDGVVAIELDGQMVQVLATLLPAERAAGATVRAGDRVRIAAVDADHNRCTVSLH